MRKKRVSSGKKSHNGLIVTCGILLFLGFFMAIYLDNLVESGFKLKFSSPEEGQQIYYSFDDFVDVKQAGVLNVVDEGNKLNYWESISDIYPVLDQRNLPAVLENNNYIDNKGGKHYYKQNLTFSKDFNVRQMKSANGNSIVGIGAGVGNLLNYSLIFDDPVNFADLPGSKLKFLGREYYVVNLNTVKNEMVLMKDITDEFELSINMSSNSKVSHTTSHSFDVSADRIGIDAGGVTLNVNSQNIDFGVADVFKKVPSISKDVYIGLVGVDDSSTAGITKVKIVIGLEARPLNSTMDYGKNFTYQFKPEYLSGKIKSFTLAYNGTLNAHSGKDVYLPYFNSLRISPGDFAGYESEREKTLFRKTGYNSASHTYGFVYANVSIQDGRYEFPIAQYNATFAGIGGGIAGFAFARAESDNYEICSNITKTGIVNFIVSAGNSSYGETYIINLMNVSEKTAVKSARFNNAITGEEFTQNVGNGKVMGRLRLNVTKVFVDLNNFVPCINVTIYPLTNDLTGNFGRIITKKGLRIDYVLNASLVTPTSSYIDFREGLGGNGGNITTFNVSLNILNGELKFIRNWPSKVQDQASGMNFSYVRSKFATRIKENSSNVIIEYAGKESYLPLEIHENPSDLNSRRLIDNLAADGSYGIPLEKYYTSVTDLLGNGLNLKDNNVKSSTDLKSLSDGSYSISALFKPENANDKVYLFTIGNNTGNGEYMGLVYDHGIFKMIYVDAETVVKEAYSASYMESKNYSVVGIVDKETENVSIYVDGVKGVDARPVRSNVASKDYGDVNWIVGGDVVNAHGFSSAGGIIDDVRVWSRALGRQDVDDLTAYYSFMGSSFKLPNECNESEVLDLIDSLGAGSYSWKIFIDKDDRCDYYAFTNHTRTLYLIKGNNFASNEGYNISRFSVVISRVNYGIIRNLTLTQNLSGFRAVEGIEGMLNGDISSVKENAINESFALTGEQTIRGQFGVEGMSGMDAAGDGDDVIYSKDLSGKGGLVNIIFKAYKNYTYTKFDFERKEPMGINLIDITNNQITCSDSDGGIDFNNAGTAIGSNGESSSDLCNANMLTEYSCSNGQIISSLHTCANGCSSGKCNSSNAPGCASNVIGVSVNCTAGDILINYTNDLSNCNGAGLTATNIGRCDYANNNIIGNAAEISSNIGGLTAKINGLSINDTSLFAGTNKVEIYESGLARVGFDHNFSSILKFNQITIAQQASGSRFGYLLVKGLSGYNKTFIVDRLNASTDKVCVINEDREVSAFSTNCTASYETLVSCDGFLDDGFRCINNGTYFIVSGLRNSTVREYVLLTGPVINPNITFGGGARQCLESDWSASLSPENCPASGQQLRAWTKTGICTGGLSKTNDAITCTYVSNSGNSGDINEEESDSNASGSKMIYVIAGILGFLIIAIIIIIAYLLSSSKENKINTPGKLQAKPASKPSNSSFGSFNRP